MAVTERPGIRSVLVEPVTENFSWARLQFEHLSGAESSIGMALKPSNPSFFQKYYKDSLGSFCLAKFMQGYLFYSAADWEAQIVGVNTQVEMMQQRLLKHMENLANGVIKPTSAAIPRAKGNIQAGWTRYFLNGATSVGHHLAPIAAQLDEIGSVSIMPGLEDNNPFLAKVGQFTFFRAGDNRLDVVGEDKSVERVDQLFGEHLKDITKSTLHITSLPRD
jgi:hypothetical protein